MIEFFKTINSDFFAGLAIFITFVTFAVQIYKSASTPESRERHKEFLLNRLQMLSKIPLNNTGVFAAAKFTNFLDWIFKKPKNYKLSDPVLWNDRTTSFFLVIVLIVNAISMINWTYNLDQLFYNLLPFLIILFSFLQFVAQKHSLSRPNRNNKLPKRVPRYTRRQQRDKRKNKSGGILQKFFKIKFYEYDIISIFITIGLRVGALGIIFVVILFAQNKFDNKVFVMAVLFTFYGEYIVACILSFNITRVLVSKLKNSKNFISTLKLVIVDLTWASFICLACYYLADFIVYYLEVQSETESYPESEGLSNVNYLYFATHFWFIFLSAFLPSLLFMVFVILEVLSRFFLHPIRQAVVILFEKVIKYNYHYYAFAIVIVFVCIILLQKI